MKILWLSHLVPYPPAGGAMQRAYHLLKHCAHQHEVHLMALNQPRLLPTTVGLEESIDALSRHCASVRVFPIPAERSKAHRAVCIARSLASPMPYDVIWLFNAVMMRDVRQMLDAGNIELVHADTVGMWPYVAEWRGSPVVLGHHNIESELTQRRAEQERSSFRARVFERDGTKLRAVEHDAALAASVNVVVSRLDARRLADIAPGAGVEVVENGVDTGYWTPGVEEPNGRIVFAGTLGWYANRDAVDFLVGEIWPLLSVGRPDRRLAIIGRDPPPSARDAAADPRVLVTGFVPDVRPYLRAASICVCPIRVGGGTRLKVLDALAMAKPIVSTAIGVEGLSLIEGTHYLRAESAEEFVAQIDRLEKEPALRLALGEAGRVLAVERFDWHVVGRQLDAAYACALARYSGARAGSS